MSDSMRLVMSSRDLNLVHPELRRRVHLICGEWSKLQPANPRLVVIAARRTAQEQAQLYARGRTMPGFRVTSAAPGQSLHEYGLAVDFGFIDDVKNCMDWSEWRYMILGPIIEKYGLEWGGRWPARMRDLPHAQASGITWQQARAGVEPHWSEIA